MMARKVLISVSDADLQVIDRRALAAGMSRSAYLVALGTSATDHGVRVVETIRQLRHELERHVPAPTSNATVLRPVDIAWQAFQEGIRYAQPLDHMLAGVGDNAAYRAANAHLRAWWKKHPQTTDDGELAGEPDPLHPRVV